MHLVLIRPYCRARKVVQAQAPLVLDLGPDQKALFCFSNWFRSDKVALLQQLPGCSGSFKGSSPGGRGGPSLVTSTTRLAPRVRPRTIFRSCRYRLTSSIPRFSSRVALRLCSFATSQGTPHVDPRATSSRLDDDTRTKPFPGTHSSLSPNER